MAVDRNRTWMGLYLPENYYSAPQKAFEYELLLGKKIRILSFYHSWGAGSEHVDLSGLKEVSQSGFIPMITWEPWMPKESWGKRQPENQPEFSLSKILSGKYDDYIRNWAIDLKKVSGPVFLRPMHEMNGNWYPWCGTVNGNKPSDYVEAWRYIRSIFRSVRNNHLMWVWSPYVYSVPDEPENAISRYFPGSDEFDWLGLDGYNWGLTRTWSKWEDFRTIFENAYTELIRLAPEKSLMIAEVGCAEEGGDKGKWIEEAFLELRSRFSRINAVVWFNIDKECDWRIESSAGSINAFKKS